MKKSGIRREWRSRRIKFSKKPNNILMCYLPPVNMEESIHKFREYKILQFWIYIRILILNNFIKLKRFLYKFLQNFFYSLPDEINRSSYFLDEIEKYLIFRLNRVETNLILVIKLYEYIKKLKLVSIYDIFILFRNKTIWIYHRLKQVCKIYSHRVIVLWKNHYILLTLYSIILLIFSFVYIHQIYLCEQASYCAFLPVVQYIRQLLICIGIYPVLKCNAWICRSHMVLKEICINKNCRKKLLTFQDWNIREQTFCEHWFCGKKIIRSYSCKNPKLFCFGKIILECDTWLCRILFDIDRLREEEMGREGGEKEERGERGRG